MPNWNDPLAYQNAKRGITKRCICWGQNDLFEGCNIAVRSHDVHSILPISPPIRLRLHGRSRVNRVLHFRTRVQENGDHRESVFKGCDSGPCRDHVRRSPIGHGTDSRTHLVFDSAVHCKYVGFDDNSLVRRMPIRSTIECYRNYETRQIVLGS